MVEFSPSKEPAMKPSPRLGVSFAAGLVLLGAPALAQEGSVAPNAGAAQATVIVNDAATTTITRTGVLTLKGTYTVNSKLPAGTIVYASGYASSYDAAFTNSHTVAGSATVAGGKVVISLRMPYAFLISSTATTVTVSLSLSAGVTPATGPRLNYSAYSSSTIKTPANGANTTVSFSGGL